MGARAESEDDPDGRVGSVLDGRYRVLQRLAEGGMGVVYRAERVPVGRPVAVKFLHQVYAEDRESRSRFERETRVLFKLSHPHCVSVIDFGMDGGPYVVMDFVTGTTLKDRLEDGPLPVAEAITIARQILAGLAHAHAQGIIHRDVKPANVMVSDEIGTGNHVRILDFGLARLRGSASTSVTQSLIVVGTPNYMAPEQTLAGEVDARTDVYAVGVVLFEMLTGERPFAAEDTAGILDKHRNEPPPHLHEVAKGREFPEGLDRIIQRAIEKKPEDRWPSAVAMADALERMLQGGRAMSLSGGDAQRPITIVKGVRWSTLLFLLLVAGTAVAAYVVLTDPESPAGGTVPDPVGSGSGSAIGSDSVGAIPGADARPTGDLAVPPPLAYDAALAVIELPPDAAPLPAPPDAAAAMVVLGPPDAFRGYPDAHWADAVVEEIELAPEEVTSADPAQTAPVQVVPETDPDDPEPGSALNMLEPTQEPPQPIAPARSTQEALAMARKGQIEPAITGLRNLWKKSPKSGYIPYLLGNLYFDKKWWSVAIEHYTAAIKRAPAYKRNAIIIKNAIRALGNAKTRGKASWLLKRVIGAPARPYLRTAAKSDPRPAVRAAARALLR
jgi:serine/threonine-protein kinase